MFYILAFPHSSLIQKLANPYASDDLKRDLFEPSLGMGKISTSARHDCENFLAFGFLKTFHPEICPMFWIWNHFLVVQN